MNSPDEMLIVRTERRLSALGRYSEQERMAGDGDASTEPMATTEDGMPD